MQILLFILWNNPFYKLLRVNILLNQSKKQEKSHLFFSDFISKFAVQKFAFLY